jgi:tetratricopeptide (TPR) repeat protein
MPFGTKPVVPVVRGAPERIDFDALWHKALCPALEQLGYDPVRADQETGAGIILEMLERLFFSDLVVADMTIPNGNVYYEIGIRHACRQSGCVLISADWANPLFDLNQMRRLTYPLSDGAISDDEAVHIRDALLSGARAMAEGDSPMYQSIPGFPHEDKVDPSRASAIRGQMAALAAFQARVRAARNNRDRVKRREMALALYAEYSPSKVVSTSVALEILALLRDCVDWQAMLDYTAAMPASFRDIDFVKEQISLGHSKSGDHLEAIGALEQLILQRGDSSERRGLIGGRYKKLADAAREAGDQMTYEDYLDHAIEAYQQGVRADLNDFYPSSNLPFLYRERARDGDESKATMTARLARLGCERDMQNPWARPTLLTLAFFDEDVERAAEYAREVRREGPAKWQLETTIDTLERSVKQAREPGKRDELAAILDQLKSVLAAG